MTYSDLLLKLYQKRASKKERPEPIATPYPSVHIAGSNGKGTVAWKIAESLRFAGCRVGLYTSPHISSFRERIRINGCPIPEAEVVKRIGKRTDDPCGFFEITTKMALSYFADNQIDIAIIETGLGGEFDPTSSVKPILSIITSLSLEHTEILGDTLEEVARAKAGILKQSVPVLLGSQVPEGLIEPYAKKLACPIYRPAPSEDDNTATAREALRHLPFLMAEDRLNSRPPCRMEEISYEGRKVILDVAHNPGGLIYLYHQLRKRYGETPVRCVFTLSNKKPLRECFEAISLLTNTPVIFKSRHPRLYSADFLHQEAKKAGFNPTICSDIRTLIPASEPKGIIVVCGSFYMMSEIRNQLGIKEIRDPIDLGEKLLR